MSKPKKKTLRIALAIDTEENWGAAGSSGMNDAEAMEIAVEGEISGSYQRYYPTVTVPVPPPPPAIEIQATAVQQGEPVITDKPPV